MSGNGSDKLYDFGPFRLDTGQRFLLRNEQPVHLSPKTFELLVFLIEHPNQVIDKVTLMDEVWTDLFVEDANLAVHISILRKALNGDGQEAVTIDTFPKIGYRFNADVRTITNGYTRPHLKPHKIAAGAIILALLAVIGGVSYTVGRQFTKSGATVEKIDITRLTNSGQLRSYPVISPSGKYVAYVLRSLGKVSMWVRELATDKDVQITQPSDGGFATFEFTPDDKYLYFTFNEKMVFGGPGSGTALYRIPVSGGDAEKLIDAFDSDFKFSPDGNQLAFIRQDRGQNSGALIITDVDGSKERIIVRRTAPDSFVVTNHGPAWSPDGKKIACAAFDAAAGYGRVIEVDIGTGTQKPLTSQKWDPGIYDVVWLSDSRTLLIVAAYSLWSLSYETGELQRIAPDTGQYVSVSATADSSVLVAEVVEENSSIWIAPEGDASRARQITPPRGGGRGLGWTPDGRIVRVVSQPNGNSDICIIDADGTNQKQLTANSGDNLLPSVTLDGRYIVFQSDRTGADHIWRMDMDGGNQRQLTFGLFERYPSSSPDSKWVVFNAWESGRAAAWKISIDGGDSTRLTDIACFTPAVSPDGNLIACNSDTSPPKRLIIPFTGGNPVKELSFPGVNVRPTWTLDGLATTYLDSQRGPSNILVQPIDGSPPQQITNFVLGHKVAGGIRFYAWSRDDKQLAFLTGEQLMDAVLIRNFR